MKNDEKNSKVEELKEWQDNNSKPGYDGSSGNMLLGTKVLKKYPLIPLLIGVAVFTMSALSMIDSYKSAKSVQELLAPILIGFVPFVISFILLKIGITGVLKKK